MISSFLIPSFLSLSLLGLAPEAQIQNRDFLVGQLQSSLVELKINALQKLAELRYSDTVASISPLLQDSNGDVRFNAILALTRINNEEALAAVTQALNSEKDPYLKSELRRSRKSIEDSMKALTATPETKKP